MIPDQTAPIGAVWSGSTLFVCGASNILVDDKNIHFVIMRFKGYWYIAPQMEHSFSFLKFLHECFFTLKICMSIDIAKP